MTKHGLTGLVVDDSRVIRRVARQLLEAEGVSVREAADGREAIVSCRETMPDLVLLDWNMPVMDGMSCLRTLRREFGPDRPVVIFCTTESEMSFMIEALSEGAQEYIMKPFDAEILRGKLEQVGLA